MKDVEIVIKIPELLVEFAQCGLSMGGDMPTIANAISNGVTLPKGHGRLIDANALEISEDYDGIDAMNAVYSAPTIIEADKKGEK